MATVPFLEKSQAMTTSDGAAADLERRVMEAVMASEKRGDPPWLCAAEVVRCCGRSGTIEPRFPNADLASILVSNLCFSHNTRSMWKLLEQAMATHLVNPLHVLALLTSRVNQNRREQPEAYRLYLELMRRYAISFSLLEAGPHREKMTKSIDDALQLSDTYQVEKMDLGMAVVLFLLRAITSLLDCTLEDWGFLVASEGQLVTEGSQSMDVDVEDGLSNKSSKNRKQLRQTNAFMALEVMENMCSSKFVQVSLRLVHLNLCVYLLEYFSYPVSPSSLVFINLCLLDPYWVLYSFFFLLSTASFSQKVTIQYCSVMLHTQTRWYKDVQKDNLHKHTSNY